MAKAFPSSPTRRTLMFGYLGMISPIGWLMGRDLPDLMLQDCEIIQERASYFCKFFHLFAIFLLRSLMMRKKFLDHDHQIIRKNGKRTSSLVNNHELPAAFQ